MAANLSRSSGRSRSRNRLVSEINVTPLVDVMLVLLVIFMVTSPMLVAGIEVDLPQTKSNPISGDDTPLVVSINKNGEIFLLETKLLKNELLAKLSNIAGESKESKRIFVKGDKDVPYGKIVETMAEIKNAGFTKVALVSEIKQ